MVNFQTIHIFLRVLKLINLEIRLFYKASIKSFHTFGAQVVLIRKRISLHNRRYGNKLS